ncbi:MAG: amidophosphoribosyltransferase, partial [Candidatus Latescibacteria bacterium]|nr:amidophosphoribosyltransferase [Candidatus Latescibacterota bacterium]
QTMGEIIAARQSPEAIRAHVGVDSLGYLSKAGMLAAMPNCAENYCTACFDGVYPLEVEEEMTKLRLEE